MTTEDAARCLKDLVDRGITGGKIQFVEDPPGSLWVAISDPEPGEEESPAEGVTVSRLAPPAPESAAAILAAARVSWKDRQQFLEDMEAYDARGW